MRSGDDGYYAVAEGDMEDEDQVSDEENEEEDRGEG